MCENCANFVLKEEDFSKWSLDELFEKYLEYRLNNDRIVVGVKGLQSIPSSDFSGVFNEIAKRIGSANMNVINPQISSMLIKLLTGEI